MCDEERRGSSEFKEDVTDVLDKYQEVFGDKFPRVYVKYNAPLENVYRSGHDRQQYLTFTADYYTDAEYVAFMDSDAFLHTFVDREGEQMVKKAAYGVWCISCEVSLYLMYGVWIFFSVCMVFICSAWCVEYDLGIV
ncbi:hypothetical protein EON65_33030 [archaeon]|nr:MAG: hypothetical protein EON65_33030 [archaeon]